MSLFGSTASGGSVSARPSLPISSGGANLPSSITDATLRFNGTSWVPSTNMLVSATGDARLISSETNTARNINPGTFIVGEFDNSTVITTTPATVASIYSVDSSFTLSVPSACGNAFLENGATCILYGDFADIFNIRAKNGATFSAEILGSLVCASLREASFTTTSGVFAQTLIAASMFTTSANPGPVCTQTGPMLNCFYCPYLVDQCVVTGGQCFNSRINFNCTSNTNTTFSCNYSDVVFSAISSDASLNTNSLTVGYSYVNVSVDGALQSTTIIGSHIFAMGQGLKCQRDYTMIFGGPGEAKSQDTGGVIPANSPTFQMSFGTSGAAPVTGQIGLILGCKGLSDSAPEGIGIATEWSTAGADYAEYFEWFDGNPKNEDRVGFFVELYKDKLMFSTSDDTTIGVISATPGVIGDTAELSWQGTLKRDDFGRPETELSWEDALSFALKNHNAKSPHRFLSQFVEAKTAGTLDDFLSGQNFEFFHELEGVALQNAQQKLKDALKSLKPSRIAKTSPMFDASAEYIPRSMRKEWSPVGLLGKLMVRDNGLCVPGQKCSVENGIAVPGSKYYVMKRISPKVVKILFK